MLWALSLSFPCVYNDEHREQAKSATPRKYECGNRALELELDMATKECV